MKISYVILTYNRADTVAKAVPPNLENAGHTIDEIIWVDNGSDRSQRQQLEQILGDLADVKVLNKKNLGVSKGYNRGYAMATGTHVMITGCDRIMPYGWLKTWVEHFEAIPETGCISTYHMDIQQAEERRRGPQFNLKGKQIIEAMPFEARIIRKDFFNRVGYLHEGFGLYGHEDIAWAERALKIGKEMGLLCYVIPGMVANHIGWETTIEAEGQKNFEYQKFKNAEAAHPSKQAMLTKLRDEGWPYANPYA